MIEVIQMKKYVLADNDRCYCRQATVQLSNHLAMDGRHKESR